jgi:hypothetical protein
MRHAQMDTYKWAHKLVPAVSSDFVMDCFELARDIRSLDMRASPYDLGELGYEPVPIETPRARPHTSPSSVPSPNAVRRSTSA